MSLDKLTTDVAYHQKQDLEPNDVGGLTGAEFQALCDQGVTDIKNYINNTLTVELDEEDAENIKKTGDQTIQGVKTFESSPIVPTPTADTQVSTKKYVDDNLNTHKTSSDHDGRYYTETEIDGKVNTLNNADLNLQSQISSNDNDIADRYTKGELNSTTDGSSGADKVGATTIPTLAGNTVQTVLESAKARFDDIAVTNVNVEVANTHIGADDRTYATLPTRLDSIDSEMAEKANQTDVNNTLALKANQTDLNTTNANVNQNTANIATHTSQIATHTSQISALASGAPAAVSLISQMTDHTKNYVYAGSEGGYTAGNWYFWNGSAWTSGGIYQSTGVIDRLITSVFSKNIFDKRLAMANTVLNSNGTLYTDAGQSNWVTSGFIPVSASTNIAITTARFVAEYDSNKVFIAGTYRSISPEAQSCITTNVSTAYIKFTTAVANLNIAQVEYGTSVTGYVDFKATLKDSNGNAIYVDNVSNNKYETKAGGKNLFNKYNISNGYALNADGSLFSIAGWITSDYIPVTPNTSVAINTARYIAEFNSEKILIPGTYRSASPEAETDITTNVSTAYIRFSTAISNLDTAQVEYNANSTLYENFYYGLFVDGIKVASVNPFCTVPTLTALLPRKIYTSVNDIDSANPYGRNYSSALYLDHIFDLSKNDDDLYFKGTKNKDKQIFSAPIVSGSAVGSPVFNNGNNVNVAVENINIGGSSYAPVSATIKHVSVKSSLGKAITPKILAIGDSITYGQLADQNLDAGYPLKDNMTYWAYIKKWLELDKIDDGDSGNFNGIMLGSYNNKTIPINYKGISRNVIACAEGRGGWGLYNYLRHWGLRRGDQTSWDALGLGNGTHTDYAGTSNQNLLITNTCEVNASDPTIYANPFFDNSKTGTNRFSIAKWLERYRTMDDNGNKLALGSGTGTLITSGNINNINVCNPTHVIIQLGTNDTVLLTSTQFVANLREMINEIRSQLPNAYIGISMTPDISGTFFPSLYPEIKNCAITTHTKQWQRIQAILNEFTESDEANKIFLIPSYFVAPTAYAYPLREVHLPEYELNTWIRESERVFEPYGLAIGDHVSSYAHINWAYQMYCWLKYTLSLS